MGLRYFCKAHKEFKTADLVSSFRSSHSLEHVIIKLAKSCYLSIALNQRPKCAYAHPFAFSGALFTLQSNPYHPLLHSITKQISAWLFCAPSTAHQIFRWDKQKGRMAYYLFYR